MVTGLLEINKASLPSFCLGTPPYFLAVLVTLILIRSWTLIRQRLAGWKTKLLSFAGRLTFVRNILSPILLYISLVLPLPMKTCLLIERLMRNFLWSANPDRLKSNLVRWEVVCLPRSKGGLGLRRVKEFNAACLLKLAWSISFSNSLWAIWFRERKLRGRAIWQLNFHRGGSCICKSIRSFSSFI